MKPEATGIGGRSAILFLLYSALFHIGQLGIVDVVMNFYFVSLGYDPQTISLSHAMARLSGFFISIPFGMLTNRIGTRRMMLLSTGGCVFGLALMVVPSVPIQMLSRFLIGMFYNGQQIATAPLMMALVEERDRTRFFAYYNFASIGAMALGSFIGGYIPSLIVALFGQVVPPAWAASATTPFAYGASVALAALLTLLSLLPMYFIQAQQVTHTAAQTPNSLPHSKTPWRAMLLLTLPMIPFGFTGGLTFPFYNLFFRTTFSIPDETVGTILSIGWIGMALLPLLNPWWERRFGRAGTLGVTLTLSAGAFFGLSLLPDLPISVALFVAAISLRNMMQPIYQPLLLNALPVSLHNLANSVAIVLWSSGWFAATTVAGGWQTAYGFDFTMQIVALGVLLNGVLVVAIFRTKSRTLSHLMLTQEANV